MRVVLVSQRPQRRGAEVFAHQLAGELRRREHAVRIVYLYGGEDAAELPLHPDDRLLAGRPAHPWERLPGIHPGLARRLYHAVAGFAPDVVQLNGARTVKYGAVVARWGRGRAWPVVYRNIGNPDDWLDGRIRRAVYRRLVGGRVDGIVAVSRATLDGIRRIYRMVPATVQIPRAVDPAALAPSSTRDDVRRRLGTPPDAPVVAWVGRLSPEKRPDRLVRVAAGVHAELPELRVWIVGDGPLRAALEEQASAAGLATAIRFLGVQDGVGTILAAADLLLLTSDTEGLPGVVLEAGCLGVPAVATRVGGVAECIDDGVSGVLVPAGDESALAAAAIRLLGDHGLRTAMGEAARTIVRDRFDLREIAARYLDFYGDVRRRRGRRADRPVGALPEGRLR